MFSVKSGHICFRLFPVRSGKVEQADQSFRFVFAACGFFACVEGAKGGEAGYMELSPPSLEILFQIGDSQRIEVPSAGGGSVPGLLFMKTGGKCPFSGRFPVAVRSAAPDGPRDLEFFPVFRRQGAGTAVKFTRGKVFPRYVRWKKRSAQSSGRMEVTSILNRSCAMTE